MSSKWVEGVDFELLPNGKVKCLHCQKELSGKPAIGPHLSRCVKPTMEAPPKPPEENEISLDEKQNLIETLKKFGVRYSEAVASFLEAFGYEDLNTLDEALRLSGTDAGKRKLIVTYWANHVQKPIPPTLMQRWSQPTFSPIEMQPPAFQTQQGLTREDLESWFQSKKKEEEIERLKAEIEMLKRGNINNPKEDLIEKLREEIRQMRENQILQRLENLERYVHGPISNVYGLLGLTVKEAADLLKNSALRTYVLTGQVPGQTPPKEVLPQARESIFSRISQKYVVEE